MAGVLTTQVEEWYCNAEASGNTGTPWSQGHDLSLY
jgi:hypothetical protein